MLASVTPSLSSALPSGPSGLGSSTSPHALSLLCFWSVTIANHTTQVSFSHFSRAQAVWSVGLSWNPSTYTEELWNFGQVPEPSWSSVLIWSRRFITVSTSPKGSSEDSKREHRPIGSAHCLVDNQSS